MSDHHTSDSSARPFIAAPQASRYFPAAIFEESRLRIVRSITRGEGPALLIGSAGSGKTMLVEVLAEQFQDTLSTVSVVGAQLCTRRTLLQMILFQLGLPYQGLDEGELRLSLLSYLRPADAAPRRLLLLVDEAEAVPDRLLEELRVLTNIAADGQLLISLVLAGTSILEERFAEPKLEAFSQRVSSRSYLAPLGREETIAYIHAQVAAVGQDPQAVFTPDALEAIFAATDGLPRLINQLGDQLFWMASETGYTPLDAEIVQQAWSESQQLPAPWNTSVPESNRECVEFGELEPTQTFEPPSSDSCEPAEGLHPEQDQHAPSEQDQDMPASIPIHASPFARDADFAEPLPMHETLAATENLVQELDQLEQTADSPEIPAEACVHPTGNPFLEEFESEEVVLDRYSQLETLLLSHAPQVHNLDDANFADDIQQSEVAVDTVDAENPTIEQTAETLSPSLAEPQTLATTSTTPGDVETEVEPNLSALSTDELLVVEENDQPVVGVVPGQQFRQLFSNL